MSSRQRRLLVTAWASSILLLLGSTQAFSTIQLHPHGRLKHIEQLLYAMTVVLLVMHILFLPFSPPRDKILATITWTLLSEWQFRQIFGFV